MSGARYRAAGAELLIVEPLDLFTAVFHRPSVMTHLLNQPAPQILEVLPQKALTADSLLARLSHEYEVGDAAGEGAAMLQARLEELEAAGLIDAR